MHVCQPRLSHPVTALDLVLYPLSLEIHNNRLSFCLCLYRSYYWMISDTIFLQLICWPFGTFCLLLFIFLNSFKRRLFLPSLLWSSFHVIIGHNLCYPFLDFFLQYLFFSSTVSNNVTVTADRIFGEVILINASLWLGTHGLLNNWNWSWIFSKISRTI